MPPRRANNAAADLPMNDWEELRRTLLAMQENIQTTIHTTLREIAEDGYFQRENPVRRARHDRRDIGRERDRDRQDVFSEDESTDILPVTVTVRDNRSWQSM